MSITIWLFNDNKYFRFIILQAAMSARYYYSDITHYTFCQQILHNLKKGLVYW